MKPHANSAARLETEVEGLRRRVSELEDELAAMRGAAPAANPGADRLAMVIAHAPLVVWAVDRTGVLTVSDGLGLKALGLRPGEAVGHNVFEMFRDAPHVVATVRRALAGEEFAEVVEARGLYFQTWASPLANEAGEIAGAIGVSTDVTAHVAAELGLRATEEKLRAILDNVPDAVFTMDPRGEILSINHVGPDFTQEQVVGSSIYGYLALEHRGVLAEAIETVLRTGEPQRYEILAANGFGSESWFACRIGPIRRGGEIVALAGVASDISERKRAEQRLQLACDELEGRIADRTAELIAANESLQREIEQRIRAEAHSKRQARILQSVLDSMGDGLIVADQDERLVLINPIGAELLGVDQSQAAAENWSWFKNAFQRDMATPYPADKRPIARAIRGESVAGEEIYYRLPKAKTGRWLQVNARPLKDEHGVQQGGVVVFRDVSEQKDAEAALRKSEARLQAFLDNTPSVIYLKDVQGRYLLANHACLERMARTDTEVVGLTDAELFPKEVAATLRVNDLAVLKSKQALEFEESVVNGGELRTFLSVKFPLCDASGEPYAVCGISTDITERKRADEALRSEQRFMRQLIHAHERDRQLMAYEIHDGLVQYMSAALMHLEGLNDKREKLSSKACDTLELARHLLRRSIDEGRRVMSGLRPPILDEAGIVLAIAYLVAERSKGDLKINFSHRVSFDRLEPLLEATIFRIVQEALTNIERHSGARQAEVKLAERNGRILLEVCDTGNGFDAAKTAKEGFGLEGIRKRAALLGGSAKIESRPGAGTRVSIDLPLQPLNG